jgi:hypothetical protein
MMSVGAKGLWPKAALGAHAKICDLENTRIELVNAGER